MGLSYNGHRHGAQLIMVIDKLTIMGLSSRGAGTWAGQEGGKQLFERALSILYVGSFNQHWSLILLKLFSKPRVLSTSHKHYKIATNELKLSKGRFSHRRPLGVGGTSGGWMRCPQPPEARGSGRRAPSAWIFCNFFLQK